MLKRGFGALALTAFAFLIIWGTWKGDKPVTDSARKLMIRQAAAFEPVAEHAGGTDHHGVDSGRADRSRASGTRARIRTRCSKARGARQYWPITGRLHRRIRPATA